MPYMNFRVMSDDDLAAVIAYLRSLPPVRKPGHTAPTIPSEVAKQLQPQPPLAKPVRAPDVKDPVRRGAYLAALADCNGCHTPLDEKMQPRLDLAYAGGAIRKGPWGRWPAPTSSVRVVTDECDYGHSSRGRTVV
jgi:hypothetical protein